MSLTMPKQLEYKDYEEAFEALDEHVKALKSENLLAFLIWENAKREYRLPLDSAWNGLEDLIQKHKKGQ